MPIILKPGKQIRAYSIVKEVHRGGSAISYEAHTASRERVFFKQYKSPTVMVAWYKGYVSLQQEIKRMIERDPAARERCYKFIEFFEEKDFYQVFEFIEGGLSLTKLLERRASFAWEQLVIFAKVMMFGIQALHNLKIVHTDLKPDNIMLIPDPTISVGYRLRIVDMDWSIFEDRRAPWDGYQGYAGTEGYFSPEHHIRGVPPTRASDIYTCGIILAEILTGKYPLKEGKLHRPLGIDTPLKGVDDISFLLAVLNSCFEANPSNRPTATQLCDALRGKVFDWHSYRPKAPTPPAPAPDPAPRKPVPPIEPSSIAKSVDLLFDGKRVTSISVGEALISSQILKKFSPDAQFYSDPQFRIYRSGSQWLIEHVSTAVNETILDGRKLDRPEAIRSGMKVAAGNSSKGIEKMPLVITLKA